MKTTSPERDTSLRAAYVGVAGGGALLVAAAAVFGARASAAVALGVLVAVSNLWALERVVRATLLGDGRRWAAVAVFKALALFVVVGLLLKSGAVSPLPLMAGFGALPIGVVLGGMRSTPSASEET